MVAAIEVGADDVIAVNASSLGRIRQCQGIIQGSPGALGVRDTATKQQASGQSGKMA